MSEVSSIGLKGVHNGMSLAASSAERISRAFEPYSDEDAVGPMIDLKAAERQVKASVAIIQTDKKLEDAILDILA